MEAENMANEQDELNHLCRQGIEEIEATMKPRQRVVAVLRVIPTIRLEPAERAGALRKLRAIVEVFSLGPQERATYEALDASSRELLAEFRSRVK